MKTLHNVLAASVIALAISANVSADTLDTGSTSPTMTVALYASVTSLGTFALTTTGSDGSSGAVYSGSDSFNLESNGQVRVTVAGDNLTLGSDTVTTTYTLDDSTTTFDTTSDSVHNAAHTVEASATLGAISAQKAGDYTSSITLTVSSI